MSASDTPPVALLVEDEWFVRMEISDALRDAGWEVLETGAGEAALALLAQGQHIDILVTDIRLPGRVTGWDVAEAFRAAHSRLPVIYASANPAVEERFVPGGVFIGKPCRIDALVETCRKLYERSAQSP